MQFNEDEANYDRWRPTYVPQLFDAIIEYAHIDDAKNALEIGMGTGQATLPFLKTGCSVTAVEIGEKLAEYSRRKFSKFANLDVVTIDFEGFQAPIAYELIYSATAFHWIPEQIAYKKALDLLKPGGALALFWNHAFVGKEDDPLHVEIQHSYKKYWPNWKPLAEFIKSDCGRIVDTLLGYGFRDVGCDLYHGIRTMRSEEYIGLLNTYSDHRALPEDKKNGLEREIRLAIDAFGGKINVCDTMDLYLARRL